ncbi:MAG: response regulator transcription factor [Planctomycetia bacterium]|nr:response regulator transcription factor [Planctomycetia bacterium]
MSNRINVVIACPLEIIRAGICSMVEGSGIRVSGAAGNAAQLKTLLKKRRPQVLLIDGVLPGCKRQDSFELVVELEAALARVPIIFLTTVDNPTYSARARAVGAVNCLSMSMRREELIAAIRNAAAGKPATGSGAFVAIAGSLDSRTTSAFEKNLTAREQQVLSHIAYGLSNEEIARSLDISVETIKEHVQKILRKLTVRDRTQAAVWAVRQKLA